MAEELRTTDQSQDHTALAKGAGQAFFGQGAMQLVRFVTVFVIARYLTTDQVGLYSLGMVVARMLVVFGVLGADVAVIRFVAQYRAASDEQRVKGAINFLLGFCVAAGVVLGVLMGGLAEPVARHFFHKEALAPVLRVFAITVPPTVGLFVLQGILRGLKDMRGMVICGNLLWPGAAFVVAWIVLVLGGDQVGLSWAEVVASGCGFAAGLAIVARRAPIFSPTVRAIAAPGVLLGVAMPLFVTDLVGSLTQWTDMLAMGVWATEAQVGVYRIASRAALLGALPVVSLNMILAPFVAEAYGLGDRSRLRSVYQTGNRWAHLAGLPTLAILFVFTPGYLGWFGADYVAGAAAFRILIIGYLAAVLTEPSGHLLSMTGRQKTIMAISLFVFAANVAMIVLFVPRWGMIGAAAALAASLGIKCALQVSAAYAWSRMLPWGAGHLRPIAATVAAAAAALALGCLMPASATGPALLGTTVVFGAVYVLVTRVLGLCPEDRTVWEAVRRKIRLWPAE